MIRDLFALLNSLAPEGATMTQPLGYPSMNEEQKARAAALRIASETLCLEPKEESTIAIISAAVFILDGAESYGTFLNSLGSETLPEFELFSGEIGEIDLSGN